MTLSLTKEEFVARAGRNKHILARVIDEAYAEQKILIMLPSNLAMKWAGPNAIEITDREPFLEFVRTGLDHLVSIALNGMIEAAYAEEP